MTSYFLWKTVATAIVYSALDCYFKFFYVRLKKNFMIYFKNTMDLRFRHLFEKAGEANNRRKYNKQDVELNWIFLKTTQILSILSNKNMNHFSPINIKGNASLFNNCIYMQLFLLLLRSEKSQLTFSTGSFQAIKFFCNLWGKK